MTAGIEKRSLTLREERAAYRRAVQRIIEVFFNRDEQVAAEIVSRWWNELKHDSSFKTGLFLHDEPINTAADLVEAEQVPPIYEIEEQYRRIIAEAMPHSRGKKNKPHPARIAEAA